TLFRSPPKEYLAQYDDRERTTGVWKHRRKDGSSMWVEITTHPIEIDGRRCRMVIGNDITEQREAERRLAYAANYDPVTGLPRLPVLESEVAAVLSAEGGAGTGHGPGHAPARGGGTADRGRRLPAVPDRQHRHRPC